jgi:cellulose synthase/poly-beta-1,6-N-acetylglucosamine synthase-like glycosyltransferase
LSPRVTVLMPVYNEQRHVLAAVQSVLSQTFTDLELVVVDDGSVDATPAVLATLSDPRLVVLRQENKGMAAALNAGASRARGEYVARMDADDISLPHRIARQVEWLDAHPEIALLGTAFRRIDGDGNGVGVTRMLTSHDELRRDLFTCSPFGHGTIMIRTAVLAASGGYDGSFWPAEDYDLWRRVMAGSRAANLPEVLYEYRVHEGNSSTEEQQQVSARIQSDLWETWTAPSLGFRQAVQELRPYRSSRQRRQEGFVLLYAEQQAALLKQAIRRGRWDVVRRLLPATALAAYALVGRARAHRLATDSPIARKMARNRA